MFILFNMNMFDVKLYDHLKCDLKQQITKKNNNINQT